MSSLWMSTSSSSSSSSSSTTTASDSVVTPTVVPAVIPRVKAVDATEPTSGNPVLIKGWVRTVRKQKTLAFVEVNDGSNLGGIQCVLSFDDMDDETKQGTRK
jgi:asparaginyl-tRNA synthetase